MSKMDKSKMDKSKQKEKIKNLKILIVDDNEQITKMLTTFLELKEHKIIVFTASTITQDELDQLVTRGVTSYILKPIDIDVLLSKLIDTANL